MEERSIYYWTIPGPSQVESVVRAKRTKELSPLASRMSSQRHPYRTEIEIDLQADLWHIK